MQLTYFAAMSIGFYHFSTSETSGWLPAVRVFEGSRWLNPLWVTPQLAAFGGALLVMSVALGFENHLAWAAFFALLLTIQCWLTQRRFYLRTHAALAVECIAYPLVMGAAFSTMGNTVPLIHPAASAEKLLGWDRLLFGDMSDHLRSLLASGLTTEVLSACYLMFFGMLIWGFLRYVVWNQELLEPYFRGLFFLYGVSFLGYLAMPAAGPYRDFPALAQVPAGWGYISELCSRIVEDGSNRVDAFPSVHCGASAYFLGFLWMHHRRQFWWWLLPIAGLWCSTLYLQYHYAVDCVAGFALAVIALRVAHAGARAEARCATRALDPTLDMNVAGPCEGMSK